MGGPASRLSRYSTPAASRSRTPTCPSSRGITDLVGRMTLAEKIDALPTRASVPRLGVVGSPHIEGYHGVAQGGPSNWGRRNPTATTQFPQAYGLGATWDPDLSDEGRRAGSAGGALPVPEREVPAVRPDCARTQRRPRERSAMGPHRGGLRRGSRSTSARWPPPSRAGLQGDDPHYWKTAALLKHFLANSNEDATRTYVVQLRRAALARVLRQAVRDGRPAGRLARALMAAYNAVNGTPAHVHPMLKDIVVREWGLDGILCTDGNGLRLLVTDHKAFADLPAAAAACMKAGINHFLDRQVEPVTEAVKKSLLTEAQIDEALRGLFRVSIRLGLLDPPTACPTPGSAPRRSRAVEPARDACAGPRGHAQVRSCSSRTPRACSRSTARR